MFEKLPAGFEELVEAIKLMQKCLECSICLQTVSMPVRTRCGHSFCRRCIQAALNKKNTPCPLCNTILQRRSTSNDECMEMCIEKLRKLTTAISIDTGIDVHTYTKRPQEDTIEVIPSSFVPHDKPTTRQNVENVKDTIPSTSKHQTPEYAFEKNKMRSQRTSHELCKVDSSYSKYTDEDKVQFWLRDVSSDKIPEDIEVDYSLDNTVIEPGAVAASSTNEKITFINRDRITSNVNEKTDDANVSNENTQYLTKTQFMGTLSCFANDAGSVGRIENGGRSHETKGRESISTETKSNSYCRVRAKEDAENRNRAGVRGPGGQEDNRTVGEINSVAMEGTNNRLGAEGAFKIPGSDMLSSTKKNWSGVEALGKQMHVKKRRKKKKKLNVSIEKPQRSTESKDGRLNESRPTIPLRQGQIENDSNMPERSENFSFLDNERLEEDRLPNITSTPRKERNTGRSFGEETHLEREGNGSMSDTVQPADESSFITLEEKKEVRIRNLNSRQMNDIIGVVGTSSERSKTNDRFHEKNRTSPSIARDVLRNSVQKPSTSTSSEMTPRRNAVQQSPSESPYQPPRIRKISELFTSPKFRSPVLTVDNRLKNIRGSEKLESQSPKDARRLISVKRDLTEQMGQSTEETVGAQREGPVDRLVENNIGENNPLRGPSKDPPRLSIVHSERNQSKGFGGREESLVIFRKVGRIAKKSRRPVKFFYLGSTTRARLINESRPGSLAPKPCNPIEVRMEESSYADESGFGNNTRVTLNNTVIPARKEAPSNLNNPTTSNITISAEAINNTTEKSVEVTRNLPSEKDSLRHPVDCTPSLVQKTPTKRIDMYRDTILAESVASRENSAASKSTESTDILFVSVSQNKGETEPPRKPDSPSRNDTTDHTDRNERRSLHSQRTTIINEVKFLSPDEDSQLMFLSMDSPMPASPMPEAPMSSHSVETEQKKRRSNFLEARGAYSRALVRRSQTTDAEQGDDANRKRKRSNSGERPFQGTKRKTEDTVGKGIGSDNESGSEKSFSSRSTLIRKNKTAANNARSLIEAEVDAMSSDTDIMDEMREEYVHKEPIKSPIEPLSGTDTETGEILCSDVDTTARGNRMTKGNAKRKSGSYSDTDRADPKTVNKIGRVSSLCNEAQRCAKNKNHEKADLSSTLTRNGVNGGQNKSSLRKPGSSNSFNVYYPEVTTPPPKDTSSAKDLFDSEQLTWTKKPTPAKQTSSVDPSDFNSIIDRFRDFQGTGTSTNNGQTIKSTVNEAAKDCNSLMHDNFDDIIANVDTQALIAQIPANEETSSKNKQMNKKLVPPMEKSAPRNEISAPVLTRSSSSDKENKMVHQCPERSRDFKSKDSENDKTLTPEYYVEGDGSRKGATKQATSFQKKRSFDGNCDEESRRINIASKKSSVVNFVDNFDVNGPSKFQEVAQNDDSPSKGNSSEQDSLMNVTQHQMLLKQFEEDLFGIGKSHISEKWSDQSSAKGRQEKEHRTPRKDRKLCKEYANSEVKDVEHSPEEDDIVENTPDTKTKNVTGVFPANSVTKRNLTLLQNTPSTSKVVHVSWTPLPFLEKSPKSRSATPVDGRTVYPLYQSTPKVQHAPAKSNRQTGDPGRDKQLCFVCSSLTAQQIEQVQQLAKTFNARYTSQFCPEVTHVIVRTNPENNAANKTLKYLQGIAHRKWIVGYKWVTDSIEQKRLLDEEPYEAVDSPTLEAGPRKSRLRDSGLFEQFVFLLVEPYDDVSLEQYRDLLLATGAQVVESLEALVAVKKKLKAIVIQADRYEGKTIVEWYQKARAVPIVNDWIVECISRYKLTSLYSFLQELLPEDVRSLGYPEFLVEEVEGEADTSGSYEETM